MDASSKRSLAGSLRTRVLVLTLLAFAAISVPAYFSFVWIVNSTVVTLGTLFAEKQILFDRYRGLGALMQEVKLAETLADFPFGYLITVGDDFRAHTVAVAPVLAAGDQGDPVSAGGELTGEVRPDARGGSGDDGGGRG